jgi:predicted O-methyltransferase YrrM
MRSNSTVSNTRLKDALRDVEGWLTLDEAQALHDLAAACPHDSNIIEIGSYRGRSTIALALGARQSAATVYAVDPHDPYSVDSVDYGEADNVVFMQNMLKAGVADVVKVINLLSYEFSAAWYKPVKLLFIDGNHKNNAPYKDYKLFEICLQRARGKVAIHDSQGAYEEPTALVQYLSQKGVCSVAQIVDQLTVLELR